MTKLRLSPELALPIEAVTETFAILARRGAGKTYCAGVLAEEMLKAGQPIVVVDPTGAWWGLRASADGKRAGLPITVLGGDHGDAPLEETGGKLIADLVAEEHVPLVLDLSALSKSALARFMTDFAERLYERNRDPLHVFLDEADALVPQRIVKGRERLFGAVDEIVRRGRIRGLGVTLISQRSAVINKDVLTQTEVLIALRTSHAQDQAPIRSWLDAHSVSEAKAEEMMGSLAGLPIGEAWILSSGWLDVFRRVRIREKETFNSSATPRPGEKRIVPKVLAPVDLDRLKTRMAETMERAKANDPAELKRRIGELERQLRAKPSPAAAAPDPRALEAAVARAVAAEQKRTEAWARETTKAAVGLAGELGRMAERLGKMALMADGLATVAPPAAPPVAPRPPLPVSAPRPRPPATARPHANGERPRLEQLLLDAAARLAAAGVDRPSRTHVAVLAGRSPRSSATERGFAALIDGGFMSIPGAGEVCLTPEGSASARPVSTAPTLDEYHAGWRAMLSGHQLALFDAALDHLDETAEMARAELAEGARISPTSSGTERGFAWLISLDLLAIAGKGVVKAGRLLFPEGLS